MARKLTIAALAALVLAACGSSARAPLTTADSAPDGQTAAASPSAPAVASAAPGACHYQGADPDPQCTPGATDGGLPETALCPVAHTSTVRPPTTYTEPLKREELGLIAAPAGVPVYEVGVKTLGAYELDHLISLEIGGAPRSPANLWPEPWERDAQHPDGFAQPGHGAQTKDKVENELHRRVCEPAGTPSHMTLAEAQHLIATDWFGLARAYGYVS